MNTKLITEMTNQMLSDQFKGIHTMLIVKNGVLVYEEYFEGYSENNLQIIY